MIKLITTELPASLAITISLRRLAASPISMISSTPEAMRDGTMRSIGIEGKCKQRTEAYLEISRKGELR